MKKLLLLFVLFTFSCESETTDVDVLISGGMIHDGTGMNGYIGNVAINNDTIFYVGKKNNFIAKKTIDASGKIVSPGFIKTPMTDKNNFKMPFLKTAEYAADKIYNDLINNKNFEIHFPKELTLILKLFRIFPYKLYFYLVKKLTKLQKK